jgi:small subunit ribosomal protein S1
MLAEKYHIGDRITGTVRNLTDFGAFVEIEEGIDGLVHVSDMSWGRRVKHPSEILKKGDQVQAVLTAIDVDNRRISLSIKEFRPNEWEEFATKHQPGDTVDGSIAKVADFGAFVRLPEGLEGLMHVSETDLPRGAKLGQYYKEGDPVRVRILRIEVPEQRIGLSSRGVPQDNLVPEGQEGHEAPEGHEAHAAEEHPAEEHVAEAGHTEEAAHEASSESPVDAEHDHEPA